MTNRLSLDCDDWRYLRERSGEASRIPKILQNLLEHPEKIDEFSELWPELCSEGTAWSASFAAVPYVVEIAEKLPPEKRIHHLFFVGLVKMCEIEDATEPDIYCPDLLREAYETAIQKALPLFSETLLCDLDKNEIRHLFAAFAASKGYPQLGDVLDNLDCGCPECGAELLEVDTK